MDDVVEVHDDAHVVGDEAHHVAHARAPRRLCEVEDPVFLRHALHRDLGAVDQRGEAIGRGTAHGLAP